MSMYLCFIITYCLYIHTLYFHLVGCKRLSLTREMGNAKPRYHELHAPTTEIPTPLQAMGTAEVNSRVLYNELYAMPPN